MPRVVSRSVELFEVPKVIFLPRENQVGAREHQEGDARRNLITTMAGRVAWAAPRPYFRPVVDIIHNSYN